MKFTLCSTQNSPKPSAYNRILFPPNFYELTGFPFNLGKGSCLLKTTTLLLCAKYPFTRFLYIRMATIHSTCKSNIYYTRNVLPRIKIKNYLERERERTSTSSTSMSISSHFNALTITSNFSW